jgi:hypothetical protein
MLWLRYGRQVPICTKGSNEASIVEMQRKKSEIAPAIYPKDDFYPLFIIKKY